MCAQKWQKVKTIIESIQRVSGLHYFFRFSVGSPFFKIKGWEEKGSYEEDQEADVSKAF